MRTHQVTAADFAALAVGAGDADTVRALRTAELSRRIIVAHMVRDMAAARAADQRLRGCVEDAFALLASSAERSRVDVDDVLMHPTVGAWGVQCLRRLRARRAAAGTDADAGPDDDVEESLGYLTGVAVASALRAGQQVDVTVRTSRGRLFLPTLGHVRLGGSLPWVRASAPAGSSRLTLTASRMTMEVDVAAAGGGWIPWRRLRSVVDHCVLDVSLDDANPHHDYGTLRVAGSLDECGLARWQNAVDDAWCLLVRHHRRQATAIAAGMTALVPLAGAAAGSQVSATSGHAFGAVAVTAPPDGLTLAAALVHEFQHAKLYALLHLVPLVEEEPGDTFYAPWRSDPRPLAGLLQGAYAFLGLVEFWHTQQSVGSPGARRRAAFEFSRWRDAVDVVLDTLAGSGALTAPGRRFVHGMRGRIDGWLRVAVDRDIEAESRAAAACHLAEWRSHHLGKIRPPEVRP
jgi:HEXXH motif-containing protein